MTYFRYCPETDQIVQTPDSALAPPASRRPFVREFRSYDTPTHAELQSLFRTYLRRSRAQAEYAWRQPPDNTQAPGVQGGVERSSAPPPVSPSSPSCLTERSEGSALFSSAP